MARHLFAFLLGALVALAGRDSLAVPPSENLLPATTKGFLSIPDVDELRAKWNETQLGHMANDPVMQPFVEDFKRQLRARLSETGERIGITWEDLEGVYGGEVAIALIQPDGDPLKHAIAMLVDITGHNDEADALLAKVAANMAARGASKSSQEVEGVTVTIYTLPKKKDETETRKAYYLVHQDHLVATDYFDTAREVITRLGDSTLESLKDVPAFRDSMARAGKETGDMQPHLRFYVDPFGYAEASRAAHGGRKKRGQDMLKILKNQGFDAVQGIGGLIVLSTGEHDILHHSFIFAPAVKREAGDESTDKYNLAARMLNFPNTATLEPEPWVPRELASHLTFNWKMREAFEYASTLVDEIADSPGIFEEVLESIAKDPKGPQIDLRQEFIAFFAERATLVTDNRLPITPKSERLLFAIDLTDAEAVAKAVSKAMEKDPDAKRREYEGTTIWEIVKEEDEELELNIDGPGFGFGGDEPDPIEEEERIIPNSAITVAHGHFIIASHVDMIVEILKERDASETLAEAGDYQVIRDVLTQLGAKNDSFRFFSRTDEAYRATYELMREGKMPEAETVAGKLLNRLFGSDEEGVLRQQQIDGSKLPPFQAVRRYLGPAGAFVRSEEDGWYISGCLLSKDQPALNVSSEQPAISSVEGNTEQR